MYFSFEYAFSPDDLEADDEDWEPPQDGFESAEIAFNLNYMRPHVFGLEAEPEVRRLVEHFGLAVDDPQIHGVARGPYSTARFLRGWNAGNLSAYRILLDHLREHGDDAGPRADDALSAATLETHWRWNYGRRALQQELGDDVFVPRVFYAQSDSGTKAFSVWTDAIPIALPMVDLLFLLRRDLRPASSTAKPDSIAVVPFTNVEPLLSSGRRIEAPAPGVALEFADPPLPILDLFQEASEAQEVPKGLGFDDVLTLEVLEQAKE